MGGNRRKLAEDTHVFDFLVQKKEAGLVKHIGFSFHDTADVLEQILSEHPQVDFVQIQLNYLDWKNDTIQSEKCYEVAKKHGKPVVVMEPVKGGTLADIPEEAEKLLKSYHPDMSVASWAIRFAASHENVMLVLSGMSDLEQVKDNVSYMENFTPFTEEEFGLVQKVAEIINGQYCYPLYGVRLLHQQVPGKHRHPKIFCPLQCGYAGAHNKSVDCTNHAVQPFFGTVWESERLYPVRAVREDVPAAHSDPSVVKKGRRTI